MLAIEPGHPYANHNLGLIATQFGHNEIAVNLIARALADQPDFVEAHRSLGAALMNIGKFDDAAASYKRALALAPTDNITHYNLGNAVKIQGKADEAAKCYQRALALKPDFAEAHSALGSALADLGQTGKAEISCRRALAIKPLYAFAHRNLGIALSRQGKLAEAANSFGRALALMQDRAEESQDLRSLIADKGKLKAASVTMVSASRHSEADFYLKSAMGQSLSQTYSAFPVKSRIYPSNAKSLSACYNDAIANTTNPEEILVFIHDDILLADFFWIDKLIWGLERFDILGLAGNKRRLPRQPGWMFIDDQLTRDQSSQLSGMVGFDVYGRPGQRCKLLDGVMLAARKSTFEKSGIGFDERFDFHFYDLDLCRQAEERNLSLGAIPLGAVHQSEGNYASPEWRRGYDAYLRKWGD
ncbi:tetratricopeptide repeat protein [Methylocapsa sp. S129]|uniref:tetratricopeptide repeat protein n=1 Tax=Methylocapsa sp. S129 TaxID=1641869 RepID=UPI00131C4094|nr:tetratricopeptide repeat protein [Methylocapsa sp. S129]